MLVTSHELPKLDLTAEDRRQLGWRSSTTLDWFVFI